MLIAINAAASIARRREGYIAFSMRLRPPENDCITFQYSVSLLIFAVKWRDKPCTRAMREKARC